mmetsp:Transcript_41260/g.132648  ORF Transcript_41260/g.132648 Transcript_41260/m.132648 type:complete len:206 (+) Transcript_41260:343-960(+)
MACLLTAKRSAWAPSRRSGCGRWRYERNKIEARLSIRPPSSRRRAAAPPSICRLTRSAWCAVRGWCPACRRSRQHRRTRRTRSRSSSPSSRSARRAPLSPASKRACLRCGSTSSAHSRRGHPPSQGACRVRSPRGSRPRLRRLSSGCSGRSSASSLESRRAADAQPRDCSRRAARRGCSGRGSGGHGARRRAGRWSLRGRPPRSA